MDSLCDNFGWIAVIAPACDNLRKPQFTVLPRSDMARIIRAA